jgi:hypothetical protein
MKKLTVVGFVHRLDPEFLVPTCVSSYRSFLSLSVTSTTFYRSLQYQP